MNDKFLKDYKRSGRKWNRIIGHIRMIKRHDLKFLYWIGEERQRLRDSLS